MPYFHDFLSDEILREFKWRTVLPGDFVRLDTLHYRHDPIETVLVISIEKIPQDSYYDPVPRFYDKISVLTNDRGIINIYNSCDRTNDDF